jgi:beta-galactosidase
MLQGGATNRQLRTVNFGVGTNATDAFGILRKYQPTGPLFCTEYWDGWFDHWNETHHTTGVNETIETAADILAQNGSINLYMYHGGTNFGFMNGANYAPYQPTVTSYDYDAPLNESGDPTPKFFAFKKLFQQYPTSLGCYITMKICECSFFKPYTCTKK